MSNRSGESEDTPKKRTCKRKHLEESNTESEEDQEEVQEKSEERKEIKIQREKSSRKKYTDPEWTYLVDLSIEEGGQSEKEVGKDKTRLTKTRRELSERAISHLDNAKI